MTSDTSGKRLRHPTSSADTLLRRLTATGSVPLETIARTLAISERTVASYLVMPGRIPVEQQLRLASFVIKNVPDLARLGYQLRAEAAAAISSRTSLDPALPDGPPAAP